MAQRYEYAMDEWVEFGDAWTYAEFRNVEALDDAGLMAFLAQKMTAVRLPAGESPILTPEDFAARWKDLDYRLFYWLLSVSIQERGRIGKLGESTLRASLESYVQSQATQAMPAAQDK